MINGYVTYNELKIITGFDDNLLRQLLLEGLTHHELEVNITIDKRYNKPLKEQLFNLEEVEKWISTHVY